MATVTPLPFESQIHDMEELLAGLEHAPGDHADEVRQMRRDLTSVKKKRYANLTAWETVLVSRHPARPQFLDYANTVFSDFLNYTATERSAMIERSEQASPDSTIIK